VALIASKTTSLTAEGLARLLRSRAFPGVSVSIGRARGLDGIELVIRARPEYPVDGLSRIWFVDLLGPSGPELDLILAELERLGFVINGSAPLMNAWLMEVIPKEEARARARSSAREALALAKSQQDALVAAREASMTAEMQSMRDEIEGLRLMVQDLMLVPRPRGLPGPPGPPGPPGEPGMPGELGAINGGPAECRLSELIDVSAEPPQEMDILSWVGGQWRPARQRWTSSASFYGSTIDAGFSGYGESVGGGDVTLISAGSVGAGFDAGDFTSGESESGIVDGGEFTPEP